MLLLCHAGRAFSSTAGGRALSMLSEAGNPLSSVAQICLVVEIACLGIGQNLQPVSGWVAAIQPALWAYNLQSPMRPCCRPTVCPHHGSDAEPGW